MEQSIIFIKQRTFKQQRSIWLTFPSDLKKPKQQKTLAFYPSYFSVKCTAQIFFK